MDALQQTRSPQRVFAAVFLLLLAAHVALVASARILPYQDLPTHLATATISRYSGEPGNRFDHFYAIREETPEPNVLHRAFCAAPIFPSVEAANRVYYILYTLSLPLLLLLIVRRLGGERWHALLGFLLLYNYNVSWGFVGFTMAIPLLLLLVWLLLRNDDGPLFEVLAAGLLAALFFVHVLAALFGLLLLALFVALRWDGRVGPLFRGAATAAPAAVLVAVWWIGRGDDGGPGTFAYLLEFYRWSYAGTLARRWSFLLHDNYHLYGGALGYAVAAAFGLFILVPLLVGAIRKRAALARRATWRRQAAVASLALAGFACTLGLPNNIPGQWSLWSRFPVFVLLGAVLAGSLTGVGRGRFFRTAAVVAAVAHLVLWTGYHAEFRRENGGLGPNVFPDGSRGLVLSDLVSDMYFRGRPTYSHFADYYIVWKEGIVTTAALEYRFGTLRRKVGYDELPRNNPYDGIARYYRGRYTDVDLVLVRSGVPAFYAEELAPFRSIWSEGEWTLLAREPGRQLERAVPEVARPEANGGRLERDF